MKINGFWGELTDNSAKKEALVVWCIVWSNCLPHGACVNQANIMIAWCFVWSICKPRHHHNCLQYGLCINQNNIQSCGLEGQAPCADGTFLYGMNLGDYYRTYAFDLGPDGCVLRCEVPCAVFWEQTWKHYEMWISFQTSINGCFDSKQCLIHYKINNVPAKLTDMSANTYSLV